MRHTLTLLAIVTIVLLSGCSTRKNTRATRSFHQTKCKYNINFNARNTYDEGMKLINSSQKDDYTQPLPMFPIAVKENQSLATSQMDIVILKCRKAIKEHSITRKPSFEASKKKDPKYMYFYNQEEYTQGVKDAWVLLGKAELHKGDFMGSIATFRYILRHYPSDTKIKCEAQIWLALANSFNGWIYEAQQSLDAIKPDEIPSELIQDYTAAKASLLLDDGQTEEAIPFLRLAADNEKDRFLKARWSFILGQIYYNQGKQREAQPYLKTAVKKSQDYLLEFNARLMLLQGDDANWRKNLTKLDKMTKNYSNKDYLDQIYNTKGNIYLAHKDTTKAIEAYLKGIESSTREGTDKAKLLITLADLYYGRKQYVEAHPHYAEAVNLINNTHPEYRRISKLATTLGELAQYKTTVDLQDSLQTLATLTEAEQRVVVDSVIARERRKAEAEAKKLKDEQEKGFQAPERLDMSRNLGSQDWYFYNQQLLTKGAQLFRQKWGNRKLEDDWRRSSKISSAFASENMKMPNDTTESEETKDPKLESEEGEDPTYDPEYYLAQIPRTPEDFAASNAQISEALYKMAVLLDDQLQEYEMSATTHDEFQSRFPQDSFNIESLYCCYRLGHKLEDDEMVDNYREQIIRRYPNSRYALMLSDPNYIERTKRMLVVQDSLYMKAYEYYKASEYGKVRQAYSTMKRDYPTASLLPKFALLDALSIGKTQNQAAFTSALQDVVAQYPSSDVTSACRDILALMNQGEKAKTGKNDNAIEQMRAEADKPEDDGPKEFTFNDESRHALVIVLDGQNQQQAYATLYDMAAYNFTHFMVNTYDLEVRVIEGKHSIIVTEFQTRKEGEWYFDKMKAEAGIKASQFVIISMDDLSLIGRLRTLGDYLQHR
ncbi:MAG: hypothetical protein MJ002_09260 [Paludibacteraceae bacterium]|nr:hypothetical protein [Paludibacteraceae bacterium]